MIDRNWEGEEKYLERGGVKGKEWRPLGLWLLLMVAEVWLGCGGGVERAAASSEHPSGDSQFNFIVFGGLP